MEATAIATAYIPTVTRRMNAFMTMDVKLGAGRARYRKPEPSEVPDNCSPAVAYDLSDSDAVKYAQSLGAFVRYER